MDLLQCVGKRIKMIRFFSGIQQKKIAEQLGIQPPLLSMYENGKREPSLSFLKQFCDRFNITLSQFFALCDSDKLDSSPDSINAQLAKMLSDIEKNALSGKKAHGLA